MRFWQSRSVWSVLVSLEHYLLVLLHLVVLLAACSQEPDATAPPPASQVPAVAVLTNVPVPMGKFSTATPVQHPRLAPPSPSSPAITPTSLLATATAISSPTVGATPSPTPTPDPYAGLGITELADRSYGGGQLDIVDTLDENDSFTRYLITYPSDGLTVFGYMNVPNEGSKFPVALVLHGYVPPPQYRVVAYTERYANALAEAGYFVIHPNFRNHPPSDSGPDPYRIGFATDVLNLIAIIREQSQDPTGYLRRADADDINLWGHSMGGGVTLRVITVNNEPYLRAAVLYGSMSGDELLNYERIQQWSNGQASDFELAASPERLMAISPIYHLERIEAPISIHHSQADDVVPPEWSDELCQRLQAINHPVECFSYAGLPHTFRGPGDELFIQRVIDFFNRH